MKNQTIQIDHDGNLGIIGRALGKADSSLESPMTIWSLLGEAIKRGDKNEQARLAGLIAIYAQRFNKHHALYSEAPECLRFISARQFVVDIFGDKVKVDFGGDLKSARTFNRWLTIPLNRADFVGTVMITEGGGDDY